ncbi:MAG TPA: tRNA lysidine(34) synthetase TilS [Actinomycetota bacterium]|nr:tRNA lysidine(34) synthetase TilS [Actinomycetota bacterium]
MADAGRGVDPQGPGRPLGGPGFDLVDRALAAILRRRMLSGGESVLVAVSGGPDSMCLLDVLSRLVDKLDLHLEVAHVDHGLSEESAEVAARVGRHAAALGYDVHVGRARDLEGPNLHARARDFRYAFFETIAADIGAERIATGHTLDDRVETTVARLLHGAGTSGLAGIPAAEGLRIRPLIEMRRAETRAYCEEVGIEFFVDAANDDPRFERARVRSLLVSAIEKEWGAGAVKAVATSAERLSEDAAALRSLGDRLAAELLVEAEDGTSVKLDLLEPLPRALRRRVLEAAVGRVRDRSGGIDAALDALDDPAVVHPVRFAVASGKEIVIESDRVSIRGLD